MLMKYRRKFFRYFKSKFAFPKKLQVSDFESQNISFQNILLRYFKTSAETFKITL